MIYVALILAATVVIMSLVYHGEWLLMTGAAPDAIASANAIGESPQFPVPP
jgi:hypothetical protein